MVNQNTTYMTTKPITHAPTSEYIQLLDNISDLWTRAKEKAARAVNTELLNANWETGRYIVEFEQGGAARAQYGKNCS